jgi:hypothetical protein
MTLISLTPQHIIPPFLVMSLKRFYSQPKENIMLKRLTRKLFTLFVLVSALSVVSFTPAPSAAASTSRIRICWDVPLDYGCYPTNRWCCDGDGNCGCGN